MFPLSSLAFQSLRVARAPILPKDKGKVSKWDVAWSLMRRNLKVRQTEVLNMYTFSNCGMVAQVAIGGYSPNWCVGDSIDGSVVFLYSWRVGEGLTTGIAGRYYNS